MGILSDVADAVLHRTGAASQRSPSEEALAIHAGSPVVDLVVGTALFRGTFLAASGRGHADVPRLRAAHVNVVGLTIATRYPDLRGSLSRFHFRSLGIPRRRLSTNMAIADWLIERIDRWCAGSAGGLRLLRNEADLADCLSTGGPLGVFIGIQGGHVLDGELANMQALRQRGVRMFALAHVMDNELVGSATGVRRTGISGFGREVISELERQSIIVDLAHMSIRGIEDALSIVRRPVALSHTGLIERSGRQTRWRRYSPATRNVPAAIAAAVGQAGGVVGIVLASQLLGGARIDDAVATFRLAIERAGPAGVAVGSDMDGGLRMVVDAAGLPLVTDGLLAAGLPADVIRAVMGGNAVRLLRGSLT